MTAYFSTFYQLIVFPFDFVKSYRHQTPLKLCFFSLTIFCLSQLHQTTGPNDSLLLHLALMVGGYAIFIVIQSVFTDFFAQFFCIGNTGNAQKSPRPVLGKISVAKDFEFHKFWELFPAKKIHFC